MPLYDGDTFEHRGHTFRVQFPHDDQADAPWIGCDGHGPVSDWTTRDKEPGERVLATDRTHRMYYDFAEAIKIAKRDQWGTADGQQPGETIAAYRARAVEADFEYCRRYATDDWTYVGVVVTLADDDAISESLWGVETSDPAYLETTARELADDIIARIEVDNPDVQLSEN